MGLNINKIDVVVESGYHPVRNRASYEYVPVVHLLIL